MDSEPRRRSSTILPKPDFRLPNLGDVVPFHLAGAQSHASNQPFSIPALIVPGVTEVLLDGKPVGQYKICGKCYTMEKPANESRSSMQRVTVGGRRLKYTLEVIQEPARARACGAGPRSSADRRPVDPPPVVQLNVFDENTNEDVTMWYDAGFMLYASLEIARPIAHGRMHAGTNLAVLTGVAVASTAYLQKPKEAGYFIFPDLSVRHEGWYRLKFSLFEAVKHADDADVDRPFDQNASDANRDVISHQSMANRMEVQSSPFQVFSAKKFPGLSESTTISRHLADQGCRVRIRREIRQRKRAGEEKPEDDGHSSRTSPTPSFAQPEHFRSASRSSIDNYHDRMRQNSMDYARSNASRQPSIASMTQPSPTIMNNPYMAPMAPPPRVEMSPRHTDHQKITLPPIHSSLQESSVMFNQASRQWDMPDKSATKRTYSYAYREDSFALKQGARPDYRPASPLHRTTGVNDVIEADDNLEDDNEEAIPLSGPFTYPRADGNWTSKSDPSGRRYRNEWGRV